jgi:hypothetical protein
MQAALNLIDTKPSRVLGEPGLIQFDGELRGSGRELRLPPGPHQFDQEPAVDGTDEITRN